MIPAQILKQVNERSTEGLVLALASNDDGAVMEIQWCNKAFSQITGYDVKEAVGQRGTILIGKDMGQDTHLHIIEKLMDWENFSTKSLNNRKNGQVYFQRMSWIHLTDPESGNHWWLCSIIKLDDELMLPSTHVDADPNLPDQKAYSKVLERIHLLEKENKRLYELAKTVAKDANEDALTGLSNRRHFEIELKTWIEQLKKKRIEFAVLYLDLDRFKFVNDTLGHEEGDRLLNSVAKMLKELTCESDLVARLGGDEFVILKRLGTSALNISSLADKIVQRMQVPITSDGKSTICSASIGVAIAGANMDGPEQIVAHADEALYHAKSHGKSRWSFFTQEMHVNSIAAKEMASDLLLACERGEFFPYFQPLIDAKTGRLDCAEMLVRWRHPTKGILEPAAFLDTASNMGILHRIDKIIFACAKGALTKFDDAGVDLPRVSVNVSSARLTDPNFMHDIRSSGIRPERLTVEILESVYLDRMGDVVRWNIDELAELGVTIALDDFGTGHASVSGLLKIRPSILKIDRHFIQPIIEDESAKLLAESIIGIGKSLGMRVVAEGVETVDHARLAIEMGCDYLQGFYFGRPMKEDDLINLLVEIEGVFRPRELWASSYKMVIGATI